MTKAEVALELALKAMDTWRAGPSHSPAEEIGEGVAALFNAIYSRLQVEPEVSSPAERERARRMKARVEAERKSEE